jgi:hypothetical protein
VAPREAVEPFPKAVGDRDLFSDEPDFDQRWLTMLSDAAGISLGERKLVDATELVGRVGATAPLGERPHHRAEADARRLALALSWDYGQERRMLIRF